MQGRGRASSPKPFTAPWPSVAWTGDVLRRPWGLGPPRKQRWTHPNALKVEAGFPPLHSERSDACVAGSLGMRSGPCPAPASPGAELLFHTDTSSL